MQSEYLDRLSDSVRQFVIDVEEAAGVDINVILDPKQNEGGTTGQGKLAVTINAQSVQIFAPTNGYFPDGAVRHETLHVQRFHVAGVPKLVLADEADWNNSVADGLASLDNAIEHIIIVPVELQHHPERRNHWEVMMQNICQELPSVPESERSLSVCLHWTFLKRALPDSPSIDIVKNFAKQHGLLEVADEFANRFMSLATSKEELVRLIFLTFPSLPKNRAALEYINSVTGSRQIPIP